MTKLKIKTIELPQYVDKSIQEVFDYLKENYPNQLPLDGIDFYDNEILKDGNYHFFFGSLFRVSDGDWNVPCVQWYGGAFYRSGRWLGLDWHGYYRVVLLDTSPSDISGLLTIVSDINIRVKKLEEIINPKLLCPTSHNK